MRCFYKPHACALPKSFEQRRIDPIYKNWLMLVGIFLGILANRTFAQTTLGGVNLGDLPNYLFVFTDARNDANWQSASKGYIGDVAIDGIQAVEKTSGSFPYSGRIYTNATTLGAWATIISNNSSQASGITGETSRVTGLTTNLESVFTQINALTVTTGYENRSATSLDGLNTQNSTSETFVINVRSGFSVSSKINITGDAGDIFILRWDSDANFSDGYEGQVKFQSGGAIVPLGGLKPTNFIHVAGEIASSGGGSNPAAPYPQGPRLNDGTGALITGAADFNGGGFFTGYWFTTGKPDKTDSGQPYGDQPSLSNGIFVGGWYSKNTKFSMTSGTSGVYVSPPTSSNCAAPTPTAQGTTILSGNTATLTAIGCNATYPLKWYSDAALSNEITVGLSGNNFSTPTLTTTTDYYAACVKDASCKSSVKVTVTVTPPPGTVFTQCWASPTKPTIVNAKTEWTINQAAGTATIRTTFAKTFVDNTYGTNAVGWPSGHTFGNLTGSDKLQLSLKDANGAEKMNVTLDYISSDNTAPSGYKTLGVSGGEGKVNVGSASDVVNVKTSISENLNAFGYVLTTNSPATDANYTPNALYPNWIYDVWYEVTVKLSVFPAGFGEPLIANVHASPSKTGTNEEPVTSTVCPKFDLALDKKVKSGQPSVFAPGDNVTFTITVYNQGNSAASSINLTDYIPFGLTLNDPNWTSPVSNKTTRTIPTLAVGASTSVDITFKIETGTNGTLINKAEISSASGGTDDDSTPDNTDGNQPGETGNQLKDNIVDENGKTGGDEDDHDIASIAVDNSITRFDLALRKKPTDGQVLNVKAGDVVSFTIEVFNQGTEDATDVVITDYIPADLTLNDPNWTTPVGGKTTRTIASIPAGTSIPLEIIFEVNNSPGTTITNKAEISDATGGTDIDSTPDDTDGNQAGETGNQLVNDAIDQNGKTGGDEDDHDFATLSTCDLPLGGSDLVVFPPSTSADLPDAQSGQSWTVLSQPAGATASITTPGGVVSGMSVNGVYRFVLTGTAGCNDTVSISRSPSTSGDGELCWISPTKPNIVSAKMTWDVDEVAGTVKIRTTFARTFVDNTYGTGAIGWGTKGHTFGNLTGSDHLQLALFDGTGAKKMEFKIDYITVDGNTYRSLGVTGGEGKMILGSATDVVGALSSLGENFNKFGYSLTTNSPTTDADYTPNSTYPNWIYDVWYEVTVKLSAFGAGGFGQPYITGIHASPSKTGSNTEIVIPGSCPVAFAQANDVCEGGTINLLASSAPSGSTFTWSSPNGFFSTEQSPVITNATLDDAGIYILTVKLNQNLATDTVSVQVFPTLTAPVASSNGNQICAGDTLKLFGNAEAGVTYSWKGPNQFTSSLQNPVIPNASAALNGEYILTISRNGCTASDTVLVTLQNCCPTITTTDDGKDTLCSGYYGSPFGVSYANIGTNEVQFVMFTAPQTGSSMYTGGTVLNPSFSGNGTAQWPVGQPGSQFPANNGTTPVNYYVYAILKNLPADANCRPFVVKVYTVLPLPKFTAAAQPVCEGSNTFDVKVTIQTPGTFKITLARGFATIGNGPIPQDIIKTQTGAAGNGATTTLSVPISDTTGVVVIVQDEATGCASVGSSGKPIVSKKPKWTLSGLPVCSADKQTYSVTFTVTGKNGTIKVDKGTLSGNNPYTVTGVPSGATLKLTDSLSAICKFDTLITGPNCNCTPTSPTILTPSFTVCKGDTFPTMKATVEGLAQVEWFTTLTGGSPVFIGNNYKPAGIVNADTIFYAQARITDPGCLAAVSSPRVTSTINVQDCNKQIDLALKKLINKKVAKIGDILTYTLKVWNESVNNATGVEVTDSIATTVQFQTGTFVASRGSASISGNVIKWNIGSIAANGDTVTLTYQVKATQEGVHFNTAQICKANEKDIDSTPCNNDEEDDNDHECFTVPFKLCPGEKVEVNIGSTFTNVKWFKGGIEVPALAGQSIILLNETGSYTYTATNKTCPAEGCCPVIIEPGDNCCPENLCIPFTIKKTKR